MEGWTAGVFLRFLLLLAVLPACSSATGVESSEVLIERIFAPVTAAEVRAIEDEWATRQIQALGVRSEGTLSIPVGPAMATVHVMSHVVDGHRHYGLVIVPANAAPATLPVLVYAHGGDGGVSLQEVTSVLSLLGPMASSFVTVAPSFRSEPLFVGGNRFDSEGPASPWDRDVDDALALVEVAIGIAPAADPARIAVIGTSRGGGVGLLMAAREPRIKAVVNFFGPTDFFGTYARSIVEQAFAGTQQDLPGFQVLDRRFMQPVREGEISVEAFRAELVRRSPVLFVHRLPPVQVHHGTADAIVHVSQAQSLQAALQAANRTAAWDEVFLYPGVGHSVFQMFPAPARVVSFFERHVLR
jgi:dipeptidyl aminopeptidase/acylaminoacyl peptidase